MSHSELAASYAALILADDEVEITVGLLRTLCIYETNNSPQADKLQTLIKAANVEDVESIWTTLFAKVADNYPQPGNASLTANSQTRHLMAKMSKKCC